MGFPFDIKGRFESFIEEFTDEEGQLRYQEKIREMETTGARSLYISYNDLLIQDPKLAKEVLVNPEASIAAGEEILSSKIAEMSPGYLDRLKQVHIRIADLSEKLMLRSLKTEHLDILTCFEGIVIGVTEAKPLMISAHFRCASCGENQIVDFPEGIYTPPYQCRNEHCQRKGSLQLQLDRSVFIDWQKITLQEKPEELPPGQLPQSTSIHVLDDLVDQARPGDRVEVIGILKARATRLLKRGQLATYGKFFHGVSVSRETEEFVDIEISEEDELKIIDLSKSPYIIEKIRDSLAPSIYGRDLVKEAIASLLFGGTAKETPDGMKLRGESNILIVGDPGTGKSIHGSEKIYIGSQSHTGLKWDCERIGPFIDNLMDTYHGDIITTGETEVLRLEDGMEAYTTSLNLNTLKTHKSRIVEVSRHQAKNLVRIFTKSGRKILATPNHSFSTLVNGQFEVISAANLNETSYLPVARNIKFPESEIISSVDFRKYFFSKDLVRAEVIRDQILRINENKTNILTAAKISNVTPGTLRKYMDDMTSFPKDNWVRRKYDISWFPSNVELNKEFGRIIGFYLAEGNTEKVAIRFTNTDEEIIGQIKADLQKIFRKSCLIDKGVMLNQSSINQWFKETFGSGAKNKNLPSMFLATPLDFRQALLSAYFTGDGWIEENSAAVSATTKSRSLAYSISDLLVTLGIFSSVKTKIIKSGKYKGRVYYTILITGDELNSFYSQIGFLSSSKHQRLEKFVKEELSTRCRYQSRDIIPNFGSLLTDVARRLGLKCKRGTWERSFLGELRGKNHRQRVGRKYLQKVLKKFDELNREDEGIQALKWLKMLAISDIYWDKIVKIEFVREPTTVYDIGTEEGHFIVANGNLIVHNSQIMKFISQLAPRALYTTGKGSTAAGLCVSGDSTIFLSDRVTSISDLVINEFEKGGVEKYTEEIEYKKITADYKTYHSKNLNIIADPISRVWRIKTPDKLNRIITKTGNEIILTPETSLLSMSDEGLVWKQAKNLKMKERVATSRRLVIKERKQIPSVYDLIADYPNEIILKNVDKIITDLISRIKKKSLLTNKDITDQLGVAEDAIYRWKNSERLGNISLRLFEELCQLAESDVETQLPDIIEIEIKKGQRLKLPKKLDENWFYILGLIFGDGRVLVDNQEGRYGGVCIGLSNREEIILKKFNDFCEKISIKVNKGKETEERPTEYRIWSKILYHIFAKFGLTPSPKSSTLNPTKNMLYYPEEYLHSFLGGLFDSDGWISVREQGSSQIGISSTSKDLIEFVRYALLTIGIISYTRGRDPRITITKTGQKIISKKMKFELTFNSYSDFKIFERYIGFRHPKKRIFLHNYCLAKKQDHRNIDNIPSARTLLKSIIDFYGYTSRELTGYKGAFSRSQLKKAMSSSQLKSILEKIDINWTRHKVKIPYEMRFQLYKEFETYLNSSKTQIAQDKVYEYFIRKNRELWIPIGLIANILNKTEIIPSKNISGYFNELIWSIKQKEEVVKKNYHLLLKLCDSDILWDEITEVEEIISPKDEFVYDLTMSETHNFIVNGFVTHNTAAVIRDQDTGEITLEAGALVLADQGIACITGNAKMLVKDRLIRVKDLFSDEKSFKTVSNNEIVEISEINFNTISINSELKTIPSTSSRIRRKQYSGNIIEIVFDSGFRIELTPDHKLLDGNSLIWKEANEFKKGEFIIAPLKLPSKTTPVYIFDILTNNWLVILEKQEKEELRNHVKMKYNSFSEFNKKYNITRDFLSGRSQIKIGILRKILKEFGIYKDWRSKCLKYGRKASGEKLKVNFVTPELAYFMGFILGDGHVRISQKRSNVQITQSLVHKNQIKNLKNMFSCFSQRNLGEYHRKTRGTIGEQEIEGESVILYSNSNLLAYLYSYFTEEGLYNLLQLPDESLKAFIAGCLDSDGCVSIKKGQKKGIVYETVHVEFLLSNDQDENETFLLALRRFDCYGKLIKHKTINRIRITGRTDVKQLLNIVKHYSVKVKDIPLRKHIVSSTSGKIPRIPAALVSSQILSRVKKTTLLQRGIYSTLYAYKHKQYQPSRQQLLKIKNRVTNYLDDEILSQIDILTTRDYFLDQIIEIKTRKFQGYVYDCYIPQHHNFLCEGIFVHNCIDEFDKMRAEDRAAIHEAMEQHSYHPSFEITFFNGKKYPIGQFVDNLFHCNKDNTIDGTNCEILPIQSNNSICSLLSTDFDSVFPLKPSHVSRHLAPSNFIKIKYSNGREIIVTPDHPVFVFSGEHIDEVPAEEVEEKTFIPAVRMMDFQRDESLDSTIDRGRKKVRLPSKMEMSLARFLGYFVAEGYSYKGSSLEVGLSNTDPDITLDMKKCILETFNIEPIDNIEQGRVLRIISKSVFNYMKRNFPELMKKSLKKRIPYKIFCSDEDKKIAFLNAAFHGDGAIESEAAAYSTSSMNLANDYQDLLLSLGIHARISSSEYLTPKSKERRTRYKVYIRGDCLKSFSELIIPEVNHQKLNYLLERSLKTRGHDVLPSGVGHIIRRCMKKLGIPYNGYFQQAFKENCGITIPIIDRYLDLLNTRINEVKSEMHSAKTIQEFRHITNYSQQRTAQITGNSRGSIDYIERGGYVLEKRNQVLLQANEAFAEEINNVQKALLYIEKLKQFRWLRINEIQQIANSGRNKTKWVYDVTASPTQTFITDGVILHNTISIAKAGIVATLNARTSILAAANPRRGRWNPFKATADNLNLPPTILSRFDLIFVLEDKPDLKEDHDLATHVLRLHKSQTLTTSPPIEQDLLRKYIAYARREIQPRLTAEAEERLLEYYKELRRSSGKVEEGQLEPIAITPRQLESLVRLSEARAKMRLSNEVTYDDASGAVNLMNATLEKLAKDTETGKLDIDKYASGISARSRRQLDRIDALIDKMLEETEDDEPVAIKDIIDRAMEEGLGKNQVVKAIDEMTRRGILFEPQPGFVKRP